MVYFKRLFFRKWNTLFFALVFILLFTVLPYGFQQSWEANQQLMEVIEDIDRGSYDILIRPTHGGLGIEGILSTLDDSYALNEGENSFSWEEWERIELDPVPDPLPEGLEAVFEEEEELMPEPQRGLGFTMEEWQRFVNDPRIELAAPIASIGFMDGLPQTLSLPTPKTNNNYRYRIHFYTTDGVNEYLLDSHYQFFLGSALESSKASEINVQLPETSHFLVAVDPVSEELMTGIDLSDLLESPQQEAGAEGIPIKILQRDRLTTPLTVRIEIEEFDLDEVYLEEIASVDGLENAELLEQFQKFPATATTLIEANLIEALSPFSGDKIELQEDGRLVTHENETPQFLPDNFHIMNQVEFKSPHTGEDPTPMHSGNLSVLQIANEEVPIFRRRTLMEYIGEPRPPFYIASVGRFNPDGYEKSTLTAAPLGLYSIPNVSTVLYGESVIPTARMGSFIAQAASGMTTLEVAQQIKGEHFIDAIRIRVAGITVYNAEARQKIHDLATELQDQWYSVTIVTGSALTEQILEVEGIGNVRVPWINIGSVPGMARNFDVLTFTTLTLFTVFMLIWLTSRLKAENSLLAEEGEILAHIGWTTKEIRAHELKSQQIFLLILNVLSLVLLTILEAPVITYLISIALLLCSLAIPYLIHSKYKIRLWSKPFKAGMAVNYYWKYYLPIIILLWISYQVIAIITASQYRIFSNFTATDIGQLLLNPVSSLMTFLLILAYSMTVIAVFESNSVILKERKDEFILYQLMGWSPRTIYFYLVKESVQWLLHPLLSASAIAIIISLLLSFQFAGTWVVTILALIILGCFQTMTEKKINWNLTTWNWAILSSFLLVSVVLGTFYSPTIVVPTILISLMTLISIGLLILITLYVSFKKFYKTI